MLAIRIHETGGVERLRGDDVPVPAPAPGQVRLRVEAAGVNFIDTYKRSGLYQVPLPHTLRPGSGGGGDRGGRGVSDFKVGDRIGSHRGRRRVRARGARCPRLRRCPCRPG
jgi:NADPH2:quinone reductase